MDKNKKVQNHSAFNRKAIAQLIQSHLIIAHINYVSSPIQILSYLLFVPFLYVAFLYNFFSMPNIVAIVMLV